MKCFFIYWDKQNYKEMYFTQSDMILDFLGRDVILNSMWRNLFPRIYSIRNNTPISMVEFIQIFSFGTLTTIFDLTG